MKYFILLCCFILFGGCMAYVIVPLLAIGLLFSWLDFAVEKSKG